MGGKRDSAALEAVALQKLQSDIFAIVIISKNEIESFANPLRVW